MREIAEEKLNPPEPPAADDSTDERGQGSTAVLEPPRQKEERPESAKPAVDFPEGFPLRDFANEPLDDKPPAPSDEEIAMLKRMFGNA